jgi:hypothetical protein
MGLEITYAAARTLDRGNSQCVILGFFKIIFRYWSIGALYSDFFLFLDIGASVRYIRAFSYFRY